MDQILQILIQNGYIDEQAAKDLADLFKQGLISYEELITKSQDPDSVVAKLREEGYGG